jgi:hypothetical protein
MEAAVIPFRKSYEITGNKADADARMLAGR